MDAARRHSPTRSHPFVALLVVGLAGSACAHGAAAETAARPSYPVFPARASARTTPDPAVAARAARLLGTRSAPRTDLELVTAAHGGGRAPRALRNVHSVADLYQRARTGGWLHKGSPRAGDVAFFNDTHDANGNGRRDDALTLVAVVERVEQDGTCVLVSRTRHGTFRFRMNPAHPGARRDPTGTRVWNHYLRSNDTAGRPATAAQLLAGYATVPAASPPALVAQR